MLKPLLFICFICTTNTLLAQYKVSGTVLDKSKINTVENVRIVSSGGMFTVTDSLGKYQIDVKPGDSLTFIYKNKPTQQFAVNSISNSQDFNISLHINVESKFSTLKEVVVYSKSYKQDSLENRETYADVFNYERPGLTTSLGPGGTAGADVNELINIFRFKRNKRLRAFRNRLEEQEQEKYVNYRFNKITVGRITGLSGNALDTFLVWYRPDYEFAALSSELMFNQYILNASYQYRKIMPLGDGKLEGTN